MAAVAPPAEQAADLLQKLSLDNQTKGIEISDATKKPSIDSSNVSNVIPSDRSVTPVLPDFGDPPVCYLPSGYPFYYGSYDGSANDWEDYTRYVNQDGVEMTPGVYGENGSIVYHHGYGYTPYGPYSPAATPVPTVGHDGHIYGAQQYQYPAPYFQSLTPTSGPHPTPAVPAKGEVAASAGADQTPLPVESNNPKSNGVANSGGAKGGNGTAPARVNYQNSSFNVNGSYGRGALPASGYQDPRFGFDGLQSPIPWLENPYFSDGQPRPVTSSSLTSIANGNGFTTSRNQNYRPHPMGLHHPRPVPGLNAANGYLSRMYPNKLYGQYGSAYRSSGLGYGASGYDARVNGRGWMAVDSKYKPRGRGNGLYNYCNESMDGLNELNRGPRAKTSKSQKSFTPVTLAVKGQNITLKPDNEEKKSAMTPDREQYNLADFPVTYNDGKFFVIKSYSEDDVHKSIKYNVWSSTPNGNKKLDAAYQEARQKSAGCPIFLFYSVNTSGQFVGVAEMTGPVDFTKNVDYWQQDKWIGCFPVKWHVVKDVPNSLLKHITLENNENKPVTNSRDTQEIKLEQGLQLIKIFKEHASKQCILDDFDFYEERQKRIQEKKARNLQFPKQNQVWEGKPSDDKNKENTNFDLKSQKSSEVVSELNKLATAANTESKTNESSVVLKTMKPAAAVLEKKPVANGVSNGC